MQQISDGARGRSTASPAPATRKPSLLVRLGYEIEIECRQPTPVIAMLDINKERAGDIRKQTKVLVSPPTPTEVYEDSHGNSCRRFVAPEGKFSLLYDAVIACPEAPDAVDEDAQEVPVEKLPHDTIRYLLGSRYCETDHLSTQAWDLFGHRPPGWKRVQAIVDHVRNHLSFSYGYARTTRTAAQAYEERVGVTRDFAHLAIAFCRCMNIPARYVNGYLGDIGVPENPAPMDFSAWIEVFVGGRWHTFDPRNPTPRAGRVVISRGRDATDVPLIHSFGPHRLNTFKVWTYEQDKNPAKPPHRRVDRTLKGDTLG